MTSEELRALAETLRDMQADVSGENKGWSVAYSAFRSACTYERILALLDANAAMVAALRDLRFLSKQQGESFTDAVERIADRFYRERGMLAPGKSQPLASGGSPSDEERRAAYDEWMAAFQQRADAAIALAEKAP